MRRHVAVVPLLALLFLGCRGGAEDDATASVDSARGDSLALLEGGWDLPALQSELRSQGFDAVAMGEVRHPFMSVTGTRFRVDSAELQLFIYPDSLARARDTGALDTLRVAPHDREMEWPAPPVLVTSGNVAIIVLAPDPQLRERLRTALQIDPEVPH